MFHLHLLYTSEAATILVAIAATGWMDGRVGRTGGAIHPTTQKFNGGALSCALSLLLVSHRCPNPLFLLQMLQIITPCRS